MDEVDRDGDRELSLDELVLFIERGGVDISDEGGPSPSARRSPRTSPRMGQRTRDDGDDAAGAAVTR